MKKLMKNLLLGAAVLLLGIANLSLAQGPNFIEPASGASYHIAQITAVEAHLCSATAIGPQALLTATHCELSTDALFIQGEDGQAVRELSVIKRIRDGNDHTIMFVSGGTFPSFSAVEFDYQFQIGENIFIIGNPATFKQLVRKGCIAGLGQGESSSIMDQPLLEVFLDLRVGEGDSGAAVYNNIGKVIGVVTGIEVRGSTEKGSEYSIPFSLHIMFTVDQLKEAATFTLPSPYPSANTGMTSLVGK